MRKTKLIMLMVMVIAVLDITVNETLAYFTTYTRVKGSAELSLQESTRIKEEDVDGGKHVVITAADDSDPIFVRVKAIAIEEVLSQLVYSGERWSEEDEDGWRYYELPLNGGESATIDINLKEDAELDLDKFNLIVVYEFIPAKLDSEGNLTADWENGNWEYEEVENNG